MRVHVENGQTLNIKKFAISLISMQYTRNDNVLERGNFRIKGDVITQIDNIAVTSLADYYSALESKKAGDVVTVVVRRNRKNVTLKIKLVES